ncbi:MAG: efflux RND transporter periplasmic adaptor subunit [Gemmatimonadota bacterium]|nr:efflux RND transporter periplasmic adaptor subunit [Gemmatimonadota bacterium]
MRIATAGLVGSLAMSVACGNGGTDGEPPRDGGMAMEGAEMPMEGRTPGMEMGEMAGMSMGDGPITITSRQAALAGVTFAVAREAPLARTLRAVAAVVPDERRRGIVSARIDGWVERLHVNETGRRIEAGEPLLELYSPDLVTAQEELLLARRLARTGAGDSLVAAARRRLALWDISEAQIAELERTGEVRRALTLRSAFPGHVLEKHVTEGQRIHAGDDLFLVADLSTVWIEPAIYERDLPLVRVGQPAEATFEALPGRRFAGRVTFIHPTLEERTRTARVRLEIPNPDYALKPMMYGTVRIRATGPPGVEVPLTAVLPTGERDLAFVFREGGVVPTEVTVGDRGDTAIVVLDGIVPGDTVIASATFLFDSESSLAAAMKGIMLNMGMGLDMGGMDMGEMDMGGMETGEMEGMTGDEMPMPPAPPSVPDSAGGEQRGEAR